MKEEIQEEREKNGKNKIFWIKDSRNSSGLNSQATAFARLLLQWTGHQRFISSAKVSEDRYFRVFAKKRPSPFRERPFPKDLEYSRFIGPDTPWLREAPFKIPRSGAGRWKQAYGRFFSGLSGRPAFRTPIGLDHLRTFLLPDRRQNGFRKALSRDEKVPGERPVFCRPPALFPTLLSACPGRGGKMVRLLLLGRWASLAERESTIAGLRMVSEEELHSKTVGFDRGWRDRSWRATG